MRGNIGHDFEKWKPVFGNVNAQTNDADPVRLIDD